MNPLTDSKLKAVVNGEGMTYANFFKDIRTIADAEKPAEPPKYYLHERQYADWARRLGSNWVEARCVKIGKIPT